MERWFDGISLSWRTTPQQIPDYWVHQPHLDMIAKVPE